MACILYIMQLYINSLTSGLIPFQAPKQTLSCILECMAHMLRIPEEVENAFLNRTIKAFTWVRKQTHLIALGSSPLFIHLRHSYFCYNNLSIMFAFK